MQLFNMPASPLVSVLLPTYNRYDYLKKSIASVLTQTYTNWELIIVDDGSKDETANYLSSLNDPRIHVFKFEDNQGRTAALNLGLGHCTGDFVARLDSDDIFLPRHLEISLNFLLTHPETVLVGSQMFLRTDHKTSVTQDCVGEDISSKFLAGNFVNNSTAIFRNSVTIENKIQYRRSACEDYDFWVLLSRHGQVSNLSHITAIYHYHSGQISESVKDKLAIDINIVKLNYAFYNLLHVRKDQEKSFLRTLRLISFISVTCLRIAKLRIGECRDAA